ncbi:MAG: S9 family peptidase [Bacteroidales bacterium]|nr:S9 family peptidase [Bacteroidales bacterium]
MSKKALLVAMMLLCVSVIFAQTPIKSFQATSVKGFNKPVILDSTANTGKKFSSSDFLHTPKPYADAKSLKEIRTSDDILLLPKSGKDYSVQTLYFTLNTTTYSEKKITVTTNAAFKLSIDGKKEKEKLKSEDDIDSASDVTVTKTFEPGMHYVGINLLCENKDVIYKIKVTVGDSASSESNFVESQSGLTLRTMLCGENPYNISVSNSGKMYMVKYYTTDNKGKNTYRIEIRQSSDDKIIFSDDKTTSYTWMPESDILYYKEKSDIYTLNPKTKERELLMTDAPEGNITFLPDEHRFILTVTSKKDNTKEDIHRMYLPDDRIPGWRDRVSLSLCDTDGNIQPLTYSFRSTYLNDISNDGNKILFSVSKDSLTARPFTFNSIYQLDLNTFSLDTLVENDGFVSSAQYLSDNENIVILASNEAFNSIGSTVKKNMTPNIFNNSIYIMNLKTKKVSPVAKSFDPSVNSVIVRENNLYLKCQNKDSVSIYQYNLKDNTFSLLNLNVDIVGGFDINKMENFATYYGENYNKPKRVFATAFNNNTFLQPDVKEVYFPKQEEFNKMQIGKMEKYSFKMHSSQIDGRLYYPADFDANKQYPMIVYYYGGCEPTDLSFEMRYSAWLYTQQGYIVYVINPSGTVGWGQEFAARHVNAWGDWTADEIIEGVKRVCKDKPFINSKKIGCMGASYGGFMTQYLQTKTDIFAAAVSHAGISNITSYWGEGYWGYSYSAAASADSYPWNNPDLYTKHSPLFNADKIKTPLLLLHGTSDTNVPIGESIQMYNALKILGKEVEFITVKGENHGIVDFEKRLKWNNTIYAWFAKWLKDDSSWWDTLYPKENL